MRAVRVREIRVGLRIEGRERRFAIRRLRGIEKRAFGRCAIRGGQREDRQREEPGCNAVPDVTFHQTSESSPVLSPNDSTGTPARLSNVTVRFETGVRSG